MVVTAEQRFFKRLWVTYPYYILIKVAKPSRRNVVISIRNKVSIIVVIEMCANLLSVFKMSRILRQLYVSHFALLFSLLPFKAAIKH